MLASRYGVPTVMDNDANVGALGEGVYGAGRGQRPLFYMTLSTGIGGGILLEANASSNAKHVSTLFSTGGTCDAKYAGVESSGKNAQTWGNVLWVAGSLVALTGAVVALVTLLTAEPEGEDTASGFFFSPLQGGGLAGWSLRW